MNTHNNKYKPKNYFSWIKGVLFGGITATIIAILFAPKEGKKIRNKFNSFYRSTSKTSKNFFQYSKKQVKSFLNHTNHVAKDISKEVKDLAYSFFDNKEER